MNFATWFPSVTFLNSKYPQTSDTTDSEDSAQPKPKSSLNHKKTWCPSSTPPPALRNHTQTQIKNNNNDPKSKMCFSSKKGQRKNKEEPSKFLSKSYLPEVTKDRAQSTMQKAIGKPRLTKLTKNQTATSQNKEIIIEIVKTQSPQTTQELVKLAQQKTALTEQEINKLIIQLENEGKLQFTQKQRPLPPNAKAYTFSPNATWYWITIALVAATAIAVFTVPEDAYPLVYVRQVLGVIFVLFLPGYAFIKLLFPSKLPIQTSSQNTDNIERVALSLGMSLALTPMVGLILNYTPWGINLAPITLSLLALTVVLATAAVIREHQTIANVSSAEDQT